MNSFKTVPLFHFLHLSEFRSKNQLATSKGFFLLLFSAKAQLGLESFVGENTYIAEKTTIKNCIIGANCKINEKVRLTNCVIMNNVTISSLNIISGSIICDDVETSQNCEIKDCIVSRGHHFGSDGEKHTNEVIGGNDDRMMEI